MNASDLVSLVRKTVRLRFRDGEYVIARVLSIDPDASENQVVYEVIEVLTEGTETHDLQRASAFACSASELASASLAEADH
jgi:hypothetical protein